MKKTILLIFLLVSLNATAKSPVLWAPTIEISAASYGYEHPRIVVDRSGNPMLIWVRESDNSVFFSRWNISKFTTPVKLNPSWLSIAGAGWFGPDIASKGDTVYVVMKRIPENLDTNHIYIVHSFNGGSTFSQPTQVDFIDSNKSRFPQITIDESGNPIVAFMKFNASFAGSYWAVTKSTDLGSTFSPDVKASGQKGGTVCDCCPGAIVNTANTVAMLYRTNINNIRDSWAGISNDKGATFPIGYNMDLNNWEINSCPASGPDGVIIGNSVYSVFMNAASGASKTYFSISDISGTSTATVYQLTENLPDLSSQNYPRIDNSGNAVAIVWKQQIGSTAQLPLLFTNDITNGFVSMSLDTIDTGDITNADVALSNGKIYVVWQDDRTRTVKYRVGNYSQTGTSVNEYNENQISVYPNPASDFIDISGRTGEISIFNTLGECLMKSHSSPAQGDGVRIDLSFLASGLYFMKLSNQNVIQYIKLIKQ